MRTGRSIGLGLLLCTPLMAMAPVRYELSFANAIHHEAEVRATFSDISTPDLQVVMSHSSPGRYALHEFAKNVYNVHVTDGTGKPLQVAHPDLYDWNISGHNGTVVFQYTLYGDVADGTYNAIDLAHAHLNGPATFVWARGFEQRPVEVKLSTPVSPEWSVATQLIDAGDGWWTAPSRDMLMDSPIEYGPHRTIEWTQGGTKFRVALHAGKDVRAADEYVQRVRTVTEEAARVFGSLPRFDNGTYTFLLDFLPFANTDAMEHRNSTVITQQANLDRRGYNDFLEPIAHEFFHCWNVERIRPKSLEPFDLERANVSDELWFAEGFTNYYGSVILARAGFNDTVRFADDLGIALNAVLNAPSRGTLSAVEASKLAPAHDGTTNVEPGNGPNTFVSYYFYGQALAAGLDITIRTKFPGRSLDDWMRAMWREHSDVDRPYTMADLERTLGDVTGDKVFARDVFARYIAGTETMDYANLLPKGGFAIRKLSPGRVWFGAPHIQVTEQGAEITGPVLRDSPAYMAGLDRGDRVLTVDGRPMKDTKEWSKMLMSHKPGDRSQVRVRSRGLDRLVNVVWQESPELEVVPIEKTQMYFTPEAREIRNAWLGSRTPGSPVSKTTGSASSERLSSLH